LVKNAQLLSALVDVDDGKSIGTSTRDQGIPPLILRSHLYGIILTRTFEDFLGLWKTMSSQEFMDCRNLAIAIV